ncbi:TonB-dependent receptor [Glaciecola siphonariae]|uniref:TonB-dependent receptor n=1 Tax=Glaciecola siphonariae TaxID=521012 RepID=A0ABV9LRK5_9ALTE
MPTRSYISLCLLVSLYSTSHGQVFAQDQVKSIDEMPTGMESIIVKGERSDRTLLDTASSVKVFQSEDLDFFAGADTLATLFYQTPNVTLTGEGNQGPTIRGVNTSGILTSLESFFGGSQPRTTVQIDGRQLTFNEFVYSGESAWDIEQVEIFRGPQTTTQGRNAISGAVFIRTANPNHVEAEGRLRLIAGQDNTQQISGVYSAPIGEGDFAYRVSADYRKTDSYISILGVPDDFTEDVDLKETLNIRAKLAYQPQANDAFKALLTYTHTDTRRPQTDSVDAPFESLTRTNPGISIFETSANSAIADVSYELSDSFVLSNIFTVTNVSAERLVTLGQGNALIDNQELTNELLLHYNNNDSFTIFSGIYLSHIDTDESLNLNAFGLGIGDFTDARKSAGVFTEAAYTLNDFVLTIGGRYQRDSQNRNGGFADIIPVDFDESFDAFLPKLELTYVVDNDQRVGVSVEKGFNAGGFTFNFDTFSTETFNEESLNNVEVFYRGVLLNNKLNVNANVFYNDFDDMQIATLVDLGDDFFANVFSNVKSAKSTGLEIDISYQASDNLRWNVGLGLTNTEILDDSNAGAPIKGNDFQRSPDLTAITGVIWQPIDKLSLSAFARYSDGYFSDDANLAVNRTDNSTIVDLQASYQWDSVRLFLDVTNAFDEFYTVSVFDDGMLASIGQPRHVSAGVEWAF